jgi:hypothetical protein
MAKRTREKAMGGQMGKKIVSPRKKMDMGMSPGPDMGPSSAPTRRAPAMAAPMMPPMGMKKGGAVDKKKAMPMKDGGMAMKKGMKKGGMMLLIGLGKKGK